MYTSMCSKDIGPYIEGQAFDTYQESGSVYVYIRPELTEDEFSSINKHDYFNHFKRVDNALSTGFRVRKLPKKILWFTLQPPPDNELPVYGDYYNFEKLNRRLLRHIQKEIFLPVDRLYESLISEESYQRLCILLRNLEKVCMDNSLEEEEIYQEITNYALELKTLILTINNDSMKKREKI